MEGSLYLHVIATQVVFGRPLSPTIQSDYDAEKARRLVALKANHPAAGPLARDFERQLHECPSVWVGDTPHDTFNATFSAFDEIDQEERLFIATLRKEIGSNLVTVTKRLTSALVDSYETAVGRGVTIDELRTFLSSHLGKQLFQWRWK